MTGSRPVRQWQFWRKGFWQRPALMMVYAVLLLPLAAALGAHMPVPLQAARALDAGTTCTSRGQDGCIYKEAGTLDGPHYTRGPGDRWWIRPKGSSDVRTFETDPSARSRLAPLDGQAVTALEYDGNVAAVRLPDGSRVLTRDAGLRGALFYVALALLCLAFGLTAFGYGWGSRRRTGSWFAVNGLGVGDSRVGLVLVGLGCVAFAPVLFGGIQLFFGWPMWSIVWPTVIGCALLAFAVARRGLPKPVQSSGAPVREGA